MGRGKNTQLFDFEMPERFGFLDDDWSWSSESPSLAIRNQLQDLEIGMKPFSASSSKEDGKESVSDALKILRDYRSSLSESGSPALERLFGLTTLALITDSEGESVQGYARRFLNGLGLEPTHSDLITRAPGNNIFHIIPFGYDEESDTNETLCGKSVTDEWHDEWPRGSFMKAAAKENQSVTTKILGDACPDCHQMLLDFSTSSNRDDSDAAQAGLEWPTYAVISDEETVEMVRAANKGLKEYLFKGVDVDEAVKASRSSLLEAMEGMISKKIEEIDSTELIDILLDRSLFSRDIERFVSANDPPQKQEWEKAVRLVSLNYLEGRLPERVWPRSGNGFSDATYRDHLLASLAAIRSESEKAIAQDPSFSSAVKPIMIEYARLISEQE
jgi:hypothetical protein